jgi:hypothetical protein
LECPPLAPAAMVPLPSPPRSPRTRWKALRCMSRGSPEPYEGQALLLPWRHHPRPGLGGYAHTRRSPVGRSEPDPTNQHQAGATIGLGPRLPQVVPQSCLESGGKARHLPTPSCAAMSARYVPLPHTPVGGRHDRTYPALLAVECSLWASVHTKTDLDAPRGRAHSELPASRVFPL